ncbi:MAG: HAD-IA family hydrolase [Planctomycetaceae bacterium]
MRAVLQPVVNPPGTIRCVAFDAVGTLIRPEPAAAEVYFQIAERHGSRLAASDIARRYRMAFRETERDGAAESERAYRTSERHERDRWQTIVTRVIDDVSDPAACFEELFLHFARPDAWRLLDDAPPVLKALRDRNIGLALASNFDQRLHGICDALPALREIACRVISSEVGYRKPSRGFFDALLQRVGCHPEEVLMVGDDLENDVAGAQRSGINAVLVDREGLSPAGSLRRLTDLICWLDATRSVAARGETR